MSDRELEDLQGVIKTAMDRISTPPQGRELALAKTKLEEALLWTTAVKTVG